MKGNILSHNVKTKETVISEVEITFADPQIEINRQRMQDILTELRELDYKSIKHIQGHYTDEEWNANVTYCDSLRAEYNVLELL